MTGKSSTRGTHRPARRHSLWRVFAMPLVIALLSSIGLVSALTGDGIGDVIAWLTLAVPVVVTVWAMKARR
jgi:hypothetical protein